MTPMTRQELNRLKKAAQEANSRYALACREYKHQLKRLPKVAKKELKNDERS